MNIDIDSPLDSYSLAAMARTEDIISFLINDLTVVGSKAAFKNVLYGVRLIVEGKNKSARALLSTTDKSFPVLTADTLVFTPSGKIVGKPENYEHSK